MEKKKPIKKKTAKKPVTKPNPRKDSEVTEASTVQEGRDEKGLFASGNELWKLWNGKDGNPRKFDSPQHLWKESLKYFEYCIKNPLKYIDYKGKDAVKKEIPVMRAYTWQGLELFLGIDSLRDYKNKYAEFSLVITHIGKIIYTQKFEGAAAGILNANIIASDLALRQHTHMTLDDDRRIAGDAFPDAEELQEPEK